MQELAKTIKEFLATHTIDGEKVCVSLSGTLVLGRFFDLPPVEEKHIEKIVRIEATGRLPVALEDLDWGYQVYDLGHDGTDESSKWRVVLQAVKSRHIRDLLFACEDAGVKLDVVQSDCAALHNLIAYEYFDEDARPDTAIAMLDVGAGSTNLVISSPQSTWFRSFGVAGDFFTSKLVRPLRITRAEAELIKRNPSRAKRLTAVYDVLNPSLAQVEDEVQRSLKVHQRLHPKLSVRRILGAGGGFAMHGLLRRLRIGR
jgi:type IV pilus assembly protein PilM